MAANGNPKATRWQQLINNTFRVTKKQLGEDLINLVISRDGVEQQAKGGGVQLGKRSATANEGILLLWMEEEELTESRGGGGGRAPARERR